jgi:type IV pilus assembly protein PilM
MPERVVGLDIGRDRIRAVEIENPRKPKPTVVRAHEIALPDGAVRSGEVREIHTVASALKKLWASGGFKSKNVVLGMGNQRVLARDLTVPKMPLADIRASLPFQVQDLLPVPVGDAILDFYPVSESMGENGPVVNGLLIAAIKEAVDSNVAAVRSAGLVPVEVDLIPFALTRLIAARGGSDVIALIDIGATTTNVVVAVAGVPEFVRIIPTGGDEVTNVLATRLGVVGPTAENLKRASRLGSAGNTPDERRVSEVLNEATYELLNSLRNTVNYFVNSRPQHRPSRIILTGGGAQLGGLAEALAELTHTPVTIGDPFERVIVSRSISAANNSPSPVSLAVALGLALGSAA